MTALHAFGGTWRFKYLPTLLSKLPQPHQGEVAQTILRDMVDDKQEAWHMREVVAAAETVGPIPPDILAVFARRRASEERSTRSYEPRPDPVIDIGAIVAGKCVTDPGDVAAIVGSFKREASYGASLEGLSAIMRAQLGVAGRIDHLRAVAAADIDIDDVLALLVQAATAWTPSRAVAEAAREIAPGLIDRRPFDLLGYHWHQAIEPLLSLTALDRPGLLRRLIRAIGTRVDELGSSSLFWLARQVHNDLLTPAHRRDVLGFTLGRFEAIVTADEPDGGWRPELMPPEALSTAMAGLIWTSLGDPAPRRRWRATHVVRRLARLGETDTLDAILARLPDDDAGPFIDTRLRFYAELARTHLLVAATRVAAESPDALRNVIPELRRTASRSNLHVVQRHWAARALLALERSGGLAFSPDERNELLRVMERAPASPAIPPPAVSVEGEEYSFPMDFDRREANPIARAFGISHAELARRAGRAIRGQLGCEPVRAWAADPRSPLGIYNRRHRGGPENLTLAEYEAWQGLFLSIGELLEGEGPAPDLTGDNRYLLAEQFLTAPPEWLSDLRDPDPTSSWPEPSIPRDDDDWEWLVTPADLEHAMLDSDGLRIAGEWSRHWSLAREDGAIGSALVRPEFATDLLRALQTYQGRFPWIPTDGGEINLGFQKMRVTPWVAKDDRTGGIDSLDPFAGNLAGPYSPGRVIRRMLRLRASVDRRAWESGDGRPPFRAKWSAWSEPPRTAMTSGWTTAASLVYHSRTSLARSRR
ncbi:hypothetical protein D3Y57_12010 [Sphingomonas paeninsulae]|uniref:Uncharacterized protein n=1 Tax=Sphingomonas paeninsulae TaxID=2319844 RepID=A0A494TGW8_SPHPE|nr:hypothetical protein [Sphingomonas paeninsulae]AYJ86562.1 hypothetical protein D3Y57_12010 [Sphingomonas paeninsulae]